MKNFTNALNTHFPNALPEADYIAQTHQILAQHGFSADNTIACVGLCRDEITRSLLDIVQATWGEAFNFSSLGGMIFLGKTGFGAAHNHAPIVDGRERYLYITMPHIAISESGEIGACIRPGRAKPSGACGALMAFEQELNSGALSENMPLDMDDVEQSLLKQRMFEVISNQPSGSGQQPPTPRDMNMPPTTEYRPPNTDLVTITKLARTRALTDLRHTINQTVDPSTCDYAILSGIQIHGPNNAQYVCPVGNEENNSGEISGEIIVVKNGEESIIGSTVRPRPHVPTPRQP